MKGKVENAKILGPTLSLLSLGVLRGVEIFQSRAALHLIVFEFRQLLVSMERTLLGDAAQHKIFRAVAREIQISSLVEEDIKKS